MAAKGILILCAQTLLIQSAFSQCINRASGMTAPYGCAGSLAGLGFATPGFAASGLYDGLAYSGCAGRGLAYDGLFGPAMEFTATSGGSLPVTSSSAMSPVGISVVSDNVYEGILSVVGELPFVGTTAIDGVLPNAGIGVINHNCGNGLNIMSSLSAISSPASIATMAGPAFAAPGLAYDGLYGPGLAASAFGAPAFAYDGLMAPGFGYDSLAYTGAGCAGRGLAYDGLAYAYPIEAIEITPTSGGALPVSSASAIPPTGIAVSSDNAYEGILSVGGELPFVGTVGVQGEVCTAGAGAVNHACGNGRNAMISENSAFAPAGAYGLMGAFSSAAGFGPGFGTTGLGYHGGLAGRGCGYAF